MKDILVNYIGWVGMASCTIAYVLLNAKIIRYNGVLYQMMNLIGGVGLMLSAFFVRDIPNVAVNIVWCFIAFFGILRYSRKAIQVRK
ncbi:CBU_0592 family membrane protein [Olivibacter sitiensis]|uniref:CBU_0592 family membrane protein n=1 Tax=Olivibacter sitiensis TaxID=376470 RepID=UPI00055D6EF1|nr:hypothetical protein [Olivibacter sitiensis]